MQQPAQPGTPIEVLSIGSPAFKRVIMASTKLAETFGYWRRPAAGAATDVPEMTPVDNLRWVYKCKNPVIEPPADIDTSAFLTTAQPDMPLPEGFTVETTASFGAGGDILRPRGIDGSKDQLFAGVADLLFGKDIAFANFESPVTHGDLIEEVIGDAGPPIESSAPEHFDIIACHEGQTFDVLNLANNHILDLGAEGIAATLELIQSRGIAVTGVSDGPTPATVLEKAGLKIGFASATFGLNGRDSNEAGGFVINVSTLSSKSTPPDLSLLKAQIDDCRAQGCDFVVASVHWGHEFEFFPRKDQITAARALADYGADAVICHHPHVIGPAEVYETSRDSGRRVPIAYSLGSLLWGFSAPHIALSTVLSLDLAKGTGPEGPKTYVKGMELTPVFRTQSADGVARLHPLVALDQNGGADTAAIGLAADYAQRVLGYSKAG